MPLVIKVCVVTLTRVDLKDVLDTVYSTITELQDTQSSPADQTRRIRTLIELRYTLSQRVMDSD